METSRQACTTTTLFTKWDIFISFINLMKLIEKKYILFKLFF